MKNTLNELNSLVERWSALRKQRPGETDFGAWGYADFQAQDFDSLFASWKSNLETIVNRTRVADEPEERFLDSVVSKLLRETRVHVNNAINNGMGWLLQNTPFVANVLTITSHLSAIFSKRSDLRKALLKVANSKLNDSVLSVEKVSPIAYAVIAHHQKIIDQKTLIDDIVKSAEIIDEELLNLKTTASKSHKEIADLVDVANQNEADLKQRKDDLKKLLEDADKTLGEINRQKVASDQEVAQSAGLLAKANEQVAKALQDINRQGLAGAFASQASRVAGERVWWVIAFGFSMLWLVCVAFWIWFGIPTQDASLLNPKLQLGAVPLLLPGIWSGWFSARQVGILSRIQQDYAYKASTAVAFEGYKKEIANAHDEALSKQLLETAITNFGENPVRLYEQGKQDHGHPIEELVDKVNDPATRNFIVELLKAIKPEFKK